MPLTIRVLIGLVAGFLLGLALANSASPVAASILAIVGPVGSVFINLIRMTVLPLVASMLVASVGALGAAGALGRAGVRAIVLAVALLGAAAVLSLVVAQPILARLHVDQQAAMALGGRTESTGAAAPSGTPSLGQWFIDLVPANVFQAAAEGAMLPMIVFAVLFGLALARVTEAARAATLRVIEGIADAMQRLVSWILQLAPIGVFALAVPLASKLGLSAAGAVIAYIVLVVSLTVLVAVVLLYPVGIVMGKLSPREFIAVCAPAQTVAFAARSSLAALPAMVESAKRVRLPAIVSGFILPMAASTFRVGGAVAQVVGVLFLARLYGLPLTPADLGTIIFIVVLTTFAVPGIPGGSIIAMVPVLTAVNVPVDGIGILLAVDSIPDMFRTTANVTGSMTVAVALGEQMATTESTLTPTRS